VPLLICEYNNYKRRIKMTINLVTWTIAAPKLGRALIMVGVLWVIAMALKWLPSEQTHLLWMVGLMMLGFVWLLGAHTMRSRHIEQAPLPSYLQRKLREVYPHLSASDCEKVEQGFRQFILAVLHSKGKFVAMPSQAVDALWHEFILHTRAYELWSKAALGSFLHHTPAEVLGKTAKNNDGLRRAWYWACKHEGLNPRTPERLPLLFALDAQLAIPDGFRYTTDCHGPQRRKDDGGSAGGGCGGGFCTADFSSASYSGDAASFGGAESSGDGSSSDGSCGGGCGGGD
jgi:hypothetical protein